MTMLRRLLGIHHNGSAEDNARAEETAELERLISRERQELRQTMQRIESGTRIPMTWAGAMKLMGDRK